MASPWNYLFLLTPFFIHSSSSTITIPYNDHCSSIVPQSKATSLTHLHSIPDLSIYDFTGGQRLPRWTPPDNTLGYVEKSINIRIGYDHYQTEDAAIYQVHAVVYIHSPRTSAQQTETTAGTSSGGHELIKFIMKGFWSEISRKLCMVGSASLTDTSTGKQSNFDAVLKMKYASETNPTVYSSVASGTLESTISEENDARYFDPISMFAFPDTRHYNYSIVSKLVGKEVYSNDADESIKLEPNQCCSIIGSRSINMDLNCGEERGYCSPFGARVLLLSPIDKCVEYDTKFRFNAKFVNTSYYDGSFSRKSTLIGEAEWDDKTNALQGIFCKLLDPLSHFRDAVGDCTMRLILRYPSILTITKDSKIVGRIWSSKSVNESGYFKSIDLTSSDENNMVPFPGPKYEYTETDRVRMSCERKPLKKKGVAYPDGLSSYMRFDMFIRNRDGSNAAGYAAPISVGNNLYQGDGVVSAVVVSPVNISYRLSMNALYLLVSENWMTSFENLIEVKAEGVYYGETGYLCMMGCVKLVNDSMDCEIVVKMQFPPVDSKGGLVKGAIESTRARTDTLHFNTLFLQSGFHYNNEAKEESTLRMDLEIMIFLISNALACVFVALQIFHVKRSPEVPSFISVVMLLVLSGGHVIPLILKFDVVFLMNVNSGRVDVYEVAVRVVSMVAFLFYIRLLQLVWSCKHGDMNEKLGFNEEKKAWFVSIMMYILGGVDTLLLKWIQNRYVDTQMWWDLRSYGGLILDAFLLPQIMLNVFGGSKKKALSSSFYVGISLIRLVPHGYNLHRSLNYPKFPLADFYSTVWDIVISYGIIVLAIVVFFQQRHGGRCILPKISRKLMIYEKLPAVEDNDGSKLMRNLSMVLVIAISFVSCLCIYVMIINIPSFPY